MSEGRRPSEAVQDAHVEMVAILESFGLQSPRVFGSTAARTDTAESDLDLLVNINPEVDLLALIDAAEALEALPGCPVDIETSRSVAETHAIKRSAVGLETLVGSDYSTAPGA